MERQPKQPQDKKDLLPGAVRAYLRAEEFSRNPEFDRDARVRWFNCLGTIEHFMTPHERGALYRFKESQVKKEEE